ncbi:hypothetical protein QOT17_023993 [Balamuthia mandrillaris]
MFFYEKFEKITDIFGPLALYETNHGMSPETSSIGTTAFQTSRPQRLRPSHHFDRSLAKAFINSSIGLFPTSIKLVSVRLFPYQPYHNTFYDYLKAFFFGRALLPHIKSKYKQQTLRNKP